MVTRKRKVHLEHALPATQDPTCYADLQAMTQLPWDDFPPIATGESPATLPLAQPMPSAPDHGPPMLSSSIPMDMAVEPTLAMSAPDGPTSDHEVNVTSASQAQPSMADGGDGITHGNPHKRSRLGTMHPCSSSMDTPASHGTTPSTLALSTAGRTSSNPSLPSTQPCSSMPPTQHVLPRSTAASSHADMVDPTLVVDDENPVGSIGLSPLPSPQEDTNLQQGIQTDNIQSPHKENSMPPLSSVQAAQHEHAPNAHSPSQHPASPQPLVDASVLSTPQQQHQDDPTMMITPTRTAMDVVHGLLQTLSTTPDHAPRGDALMSPCAASPLMLLLASAGRVLHTTQTPPTAAAAPSPPPSHQTQQPSAPPTTTVAALSPSPPPHHHNPGAPLLALPQAGSASAWVDQGAVLEQGRQRRTLQQQATMHTTCPLGHTALVGAHEVQLEDVVRVGIPPPPLHMGRMVMSATQYEELLRIDEVELVEKLQQEQQQEGVQKGTQQHVDHLHLADFFDSDPEFHLALADMDASAVQRPQVVDHDAAVHVDHASHSDHHVAAATKPLGPASLPVPCTAAEERPWTAAEEGPCTQTEGFMTQVVLPAVHDGTGMLTGDMIPCTIVEDAAGGDAPAAPDATTPAAAVHDAGGAAHVCDDTEQGMDIVQGMDTSQGMVDTVQDMDTEIQNQQEPTTSSTVDTHDQQQRSQCAEQVQQDVVHEQDAPRETAQGAAYLSSIGTHDCDKEYALVDILVRHAQQYLHVWECLLMDVKGLLSAHSMEDVQGSRLLPRRIREYLCREYL